MELTRIHQIAVYARDLDETITFYRDMLGAKFVQKFDPPGLVFFDFSGVRVLFEQTGPKATLYLRVSDIETVHAELVAKGIVFRQAPCLIHRDDAGVFGPAGEEEWMAFFTDPSDNLLALATRKPGHSSTVA